MAKLTVADYRTRIREIIDLTSADVSDGLINLFLTEAARYAQSWNQGQWPFFRKKWTVAWPQDTRVRTITQLDALHGDSQDIGEISGMRSDDYRWFKYMSQMDFHRLVERDDTTTGKPRVWVPYGLTIELWPEPTVDTDIDIYGWAKPADWVSDGAGGLSDMPEDFDDAIFAWAMGKVYAQQDEPQSSLFWLNTADVHLARLEDKYDAGVPADMVMNGNPRNRWRPETPGRIPFDWEA